MATKQSTIDFPVEQTSGAGLVAARNLFGEYALSCDGNLITPVSGEQLFMKPTAAGRAYLDAVTEASPYPGAMPCFLTAGAAWNDADWLSALIGVSDAALPMPAGGKTKGRSRNRVP